MSALSLIVLMMCLTPGGQAVTERSQVVPAGRQSDSIAIIDIRTPIDSITSASVKRRLEEAAKDGADAIVFDLNTPGGEVQAMLDLCYTIKQQDGILTVGWINHQAYSAGALIALATDEIIVADGARMGDAAPIAAMPGMGLMELPTAERAKLEAPLLTEVIDSARRNGYDEKLVQSFVGVGFALWEIESLDGSQRRFVDANEYMEIFGEAPPLQRLRGDEPKSASTDPALDDETSEMLEAMQEIPGDRTLPGTQSSKNWKLTGQIVGDEELLIVDSDSALRTGLSTGRVSTQEELMGYFGAIKSTQYKEHWSEHLARFLMSWPVRIILVAVMIITFLIEAAVPGSGIFGGIALVCLGLLIGAPLLVGMAEWWEVVLILAGLALIATELLVTPGIGIIGLLGVSSLLVGLISLVVTADLGSQQGSQQLTTTIAAMAASLLAGLSVAWWISKKTGKLWLFSRLILDAQVGVEPGLQGLNPVETSRETLTGRATKAETDLRPTGKVRIDGIIHDARSKRGWVTEGTPVKVVGQFGDELEVEPIDIPTTAKERPDQ